nr:MULTISPECIES: hypothetical protein [unclassified Bradyrhizobium]
MNTSWTREIGRPNSWPPIIAVTYFEDARDLARGQGHAGDALGHEHVLDAGDRQAEQLAADHRGDVLDHGAFSGLGLLAHLGVS